MTPIASMRKPPAADKADGQRAPDHGQSHGRASPQRRPLRSARYHVEQHPNRRRVLQDDGGRYIGPLNREVVEIVRRRNTQNSEQEELHQVAPGNAQGGGSSPRQQHRQEHRQRQSHAALRQDQRIDLRRGTLHPAADAQ